MAIPRRAVILLPLLFASACAVTEVSPVSGEPAQQRFSAVFVDEVRTDDELWRAYAVITRRAMIAEFRKSDVFGEVLQELPQPPPPGTLIVRETLVEVERGNIALRFIIGFGAGRSRISADIVLADPAHHDLASFRVSKSYAGGAGIGGLDLLSMEDLAEQLGREAAQRVIAWARSGRTEPAPAPAT